MCNSAKAVGDPRWPPLVAAACARALRKRRQSQQASRRQAERAEESVLLQGHAAQHLFVITCPLHRETMWVRTRYALVKMGVPTSNIIRRRGIHFDHYQQNWHRLHHLPAGLKRSTFLMWDFHNKFLPSCSTWFENDSELQYIWGRGGR